MQGSTALRQRARRDLSRVDTAFASLDRVSRARRKLLDWLVVAICAAMPLAWISPRSTGLGNVRYAHAPAFVLILMSVPLWAEFGRRIWLMIFATTCYSVSFAAFGWYHRTPPIAVQQWFYIVAAFAAGSVLCSAKREDWKVLRWCGPAALGTFLVFFWTDARAAGINPIEIYISAVRSGELGSVQYLLYVPVFNARLPPSTDGFATVLPNISHEVFAGLLVAVFISVYARASTHDSTRGFQIIYWGTIIASTVLLTMSLSRSAQLVALLTCMMPVVKAFAARGTQWITAPRILTLVAIVALFVGTPLSGFVLKRITADTVSYDARGSAISLAIESIFDAPLTGANRFATASRHEIIVNPEAYGAHNLVLDAAVIGGVITGFAALSVMVVVALHTFRTFRRYLADSTYLAPLAGGIMGVAWMFTVARLNQPEWMGIALLYGVTQRRMRPLDAQAIVLRGTTRIHHPS